MFCHCFVVQYSVLLTILIRMVEEKRAGDIALIAFKCHLTPHGSLVDL